MSADIKPIEAGQGGWSPRTKRWVSALLLFHLAAVVTPALASYPSSHLTRTIFWYLHPYIQVAFLDNSYKFFAPEPSASNLIRYELELADGTRQEGVFPNLNEHWPRLLYHRHFMLSERVGNGMPMSQDLRPGDPLPENPPQVQVYIESYANHLLAAHHAKKVTLYCRRHVLPAPEDIMRGRKLSDDQFYFERNLGTYVPPQEPARDLVLEYIRNLGRSIVTGWNRFWFKPADPATLSLIRILAGAMLLYTHLVWSLDLEAFFGEQSWVDVRAAQESMSHPNQPPRIPTREEILLAPENSPGVPPLEPVVGRHSFSWSYLWWIKSPTVLWTVHIAALVVFALFTLGLWSRVTSVLAYLITVSYLYRTPGAQFGLDNVNVMLAMYLMIGPSGATYSLDRWFARRRAGGQLPDAAPSVTANLATRLIQLHMCVIYFFAGTGKLQGDAWWNGNALWMSFANLEYQSMDMTWLADYPMTVNLMTHVAIFWEVSFCFLVWHRLLRPLVLAVSVPLHLGIAFCMGMITFGLVMLIGCLSFVPPWLIRTVLEGKAVPTGAGQGGSTVAEPEVQEGRRTNEAARKKPEKPHLEGSRRKSKESPRTS